MGVRGAAWAVVSCMGIRGAAWAVESCMGLHHVLLWMESEKSPEVTEGVVPKYGYEDTSLIKGFAESRLHTRR